MALNAWALESPLLWPGLALMAGVGLAPLAPPVPPLALAVGLLLVGAAVVTRQPVVIVAAAIVWLFVAGIVRSQAAAMPAADAISGFDGRFVELRGVVAEEPDVRERSALLRVRVQLTVGGTRTQPVWQPASGIVQLRVPLSQNYAYGDLLDVRGTVQPPPTLPGFDYGQYLARQGVQSVMSYAHITVVGGGGGDPLHAAIFALRQRIAASVAEALPEPEASLQRAILIGSHSATFSDLTPDFIRTGMIHIIATSGFKVAIAGGAILALATPLLGKRRAALAALLGVGVYILLTGATPAGVRAGLMWGLALGALLVGRPAASLQGLTLAAAGMVAVQPAVLGDTGFQMSAGATAGILLLQPRFEVWLHHLPGWLAEPVGVTLAAQVGTLPVTMVGFQQVSLVAPLANLVCLPVLPAAMATGTLVVVAQSIAAPLGHLAGLIAFGFLAYMIGAVRLLAQVPAAAVAAPVVGGLFALLYYAGCLALLPALPAPVRASGRPTPPALPARLAISSALTLALAVVYLLRGAPPAQTELTFLALGQGDALLLRDSGGRNILIDVGNGKQPLFAQLGTLLPFWSRSLDSVVLLGAEQTHAAAAADLSARYTLHGVLLPAPAARQSQTATALHAALAQGTPLAAPNTAVLRFSSGVRIDVQPAGSSAMPHLLAIIHIGGITILDAAALSAADQRRLLLAGAVPRASVLIAPRGAAATAIDPGFLALVSPDLILAAALPPRAAPADVGSVPILRTDQVGAIRLVSDGKTLAIE